MRALDDSGAAYGAHVQFSGLLMGPSLDLNQNDT